MEINQDTYVLPENSDELLAEVLPASDPLRVTWAVLSEKERAGYLEAALRNLEGLNVVGRKVRWDQPLKFPRITRGAPPCFDQAPREVQRAQVAWAAEIVRRQLYVQRRNTEACIALGLLKETDAAEKEHNTPRIVMELMHKWITQWRRL